MGGLLGGGGGGGGSGCGFHRCEAIDTGGIDIDVVESRRDLAEDKVYIESAVPRRQGLTPSWRPPSVRCHS